MYNYEEGKVERVEHQLDGCKNCKNNNCEYPELLNDWIITGDFEDILEEEFDSIVNDANCKIYTHINGRRFIIKYTFMNDNYNVFLGIEYID